jgi:hypothetical protein
VLRRLRDCNAIPDGHGHGPDTSRALAQPLGNHARGGDQIAQSFGLRHRRSLFGHALGSRFYSVVPEVYTDMIAAALAENLGFIGFRPPSFYMLSSSPAASAPG